jgi:hypothetical protein
MTTLAQHRAAVDAARQALAAGRQALLDEDGRRLYSDAEHERREQALREQFRAAISEATEAAQAAIRAAEADLEHADIDPVHRLSRAELERAVLLKQLVGDRLLTATLAEVDSEVEALLREGDRAGRYVAWRVLTDRRRAHIDAGVSAATDLTRRLAAPNSHEATALASMAERLLATLVDVEARQDAREAARARRDEAMSVLTAAGSATYLEAEYGPRPDGWRPAAVA